MTQNTSWENVAEWYIDLLGKEGHSYQKNVILPNILRVLAIRKGMKILDLACGQGFFAREFSKAGASVIGADMSPTFIKFGKKHSARGITFMRASADNLSGINYASCDAATLILAIQNIENLYGMLAECARVLKPEGSLFIVMNHPAFRIPKQSSWEWDDKKKTQYRRIDKYLSEEQILIDMHPGSKNKKTTTSFHRPLQVYFKALAKSGFVVTRLEEWISDKKSASGPRARAENRARKEIPLFLLLQARKSKFML